MKERKMGEEERKGREDEEKTEIENMYVKEREEQEITL